MVPGPTALCPPSPASARWEELGGSCLVQPACRSLSPARLLLRSARAGGQSCAGARPVRAFPGAAVWTGAAPPWSRLTRGPVSSPGTAGWPSGQTGPSRPPRTTAGRGGRGGRGGTTPGGRAGPGRSWCSVRGRGGHVLTSSRPGQPSPARSVSSGERERSPVVSLIC